jgi:hypothetical protein
MLRTARQLLEDKSLASSPRLIPAVLLVDTSSEAWPVA